MRFLAIGCLVAIVACGGRQKTEQRVDPDEEYHGCGIPSSEENPWPCGAPDGVQETDSGLVPDATQEAADSERSDPDQIETVREPEQYHGCGFPSTVANPDPCGSSAGSGPKKVEPETEPE